MEIVSNIVNGVFTQEDFSNLCKALDAPLNGVSTKLSKA